jgi:hypothetical protein
MEGRGEFRSVFTLSQSTEVVVESSKTDDIQSSAREPVENIYSWRNRRCGGLFIENFTELWQIG